jgi:hypothetical protein
MQGSNFYYCIGLLLGFELLPTWDNIMCIILLLTELNTLVN